MGGFKQFILRGNVVDLAIAVVIGAAFGAVIAALVRDFITPLIGIFGQVPSFSALTFTVNRSVFHYGDFINVLLSFLILAAVVYFLVVLPVNRLLAANKKPAPAPATQPCPECLSQVPIGAKRCPYCTSVLASPAPQAQGSD
jgi:large conductance mechanosensitive channel